MIAKLLAVLALIACLACVCMAADKQPVTDEGISDNVRIKLAGDPDVKGGQGLLDVSVKSGVVTLTGSVETQRQKDKAAKLAKKVKGVKQVVNNLAVKKQIR
jgi:hyperosmotically inducible periplasmic protein